jgi:tripartite-type tricarboxylate transporter receptor subunit TctC
MKIRRFVACAGAGAVALLGVMPAHADAVADFYNGKNITLLIGFAPGGGVDTYARMMARHLGSHLPGHPNIVAQNMPGGGGFKATNYIYNAAPKDGSYITIMLPTNAIAPAMGDKNAKWDTFKLNWLGNMARDAASCVVSPKSKVKSIKDAYTKELTIGATGPSSTTFQHPEALKHILGLKIKVISGYTGTAPIRLAMEKGEVDGMCSFWASLAEGPQAQDMKSGQLIPIVQTGSKKVPVFGDAPLVYDLAKTKEDKQVLQFIFGAAEISRPFATGPGVPADRVKALRTAFMAAMNDPGMKADAAKTKLVINPMDGKGTEEAFHEILSAPKKVIDRAKEAIRK